ncbi:MAG: cilia- and flagella-associated protein 77 [archaeon]|nr:cilia- and flagella-associated protein 77 [archaeon]MCQ2818716.1 cilia- and flagella-associated protein 77 [archaeon]
MLDSIRKQIARGEHPVGVVKPSLHNLPPADHVYGLPLKRDQYGAGASKINNL